MPKPDSGGHRLTESGSRRLPVDERRAQLLELGLELFSDRAYDEVGIDDIAKAAGISKGLLYHYFGSKRAFYVACVEEAADQLVTEIERTFHHPLGERAAAGLHAYMSFVEHRRGVFLTLMRSGVGSDPQVGAVVEDTRERIAQSMLQQAGVLSPHPLFRLAARAWVGQVEAASLLWLERPEVTRQDLVSFLLHTLLASLTQAYALSGETPPPRA